jgi:hypothetical protein
LPGLPPLQFWHERASEASTGPGHPVSWWHEQPPRAGRFILIATVVGSCSLSAPAFGQWFSEEAKPLPSDGAENDYFGVSVAIDNGVVAVGASGNGDNGTDSGSAYVFDFNCPPDLNGDLIVDNGDIITFVALFLAGS